jgi:hypothetical protein
VTQLELLQLRDLFSVILPPDGKQTVSQAVALNEDRSITEAQLWSKVSRLCRQAKIPVDDAAPDFVVMMVGAPTLGIFKVMDDGSEPEPEPEVPEADPSTVFKAALEGEQVPEPPGEPTKKRRNKRKVAKGNKQ